MFSKDDKTREWNKLIKRYITLHKYIGNIGERWISQGHSGKVNSEIKANLGDGLVQADRALSKLKEFFKPYLGDLDLFEEDRLRAEVQNLVEENIHLKELHQVQQDSGNQADVQQQSLVLENHSLQQNILQLKQHCELLKHQLQILSSENPGDVLSNAESQGTYRRKQQQYDETLKAQNDLIEALKQQLDDANKDREIYKMLNRNLEGALQQKNGRANSQYQLDPRLEENGKALKLGEEYQEHPEVPSQRSVNADDVEKDIYLFTNQQNTVYEYRDLQKNLLELQLQHRSEDIEDTFQSNPSLAAEENPLNANTNDQTETAS